MNIIVIYLFILNIIYGQIDYATQIQPIFNNHCIECHVSINGSGALELDSYDYLMQGDSNNGPVVIPFNADSSLLYRVLLRDSVIVPNEPICCRMPKNEDPLPQDDQQKIYDWINEGAIGPNMSINHKDLNNQIIFTYPNPFNSMITITFFLRNNTNVNIIIYDMMGRVVNNLFSGERKTGEQLIQWNGKDTKGNPVSTGVYLCKIKLNEFTQTDKIIFLK